MLALQPEVGSIITICLKTKVFPVNQNEKTSQLRDLKKPKTALNNNKHMSRPFCGHTWCQQASKKYVQGEKTLHDVLVAARN